jgi:ketol-acid reductoisomerase
VHRCVEKARDVALSYPAASAARAPGLETNFREETRPTSSAAGGALRAGRAHQAVRTLTEASYAPEMAYFECLHEVKLIVDLIYEGGIASITTRSQQCRIREYVARTEDRHRRDEVGDARDAGRIRAANTRYPRESRRRPRRRRRMMAEHPIEQVGAATFDDAVDRQGTSSSINRGTELG